MPKGRKINQITTKMIHLEAFCFLLIRCWLKMKRFWIQSLALLRFIKNLWNTISETSAYPAAATAAKSLQSCPTLCDPIDGSPPGSPVPGILQARTLEWDAISFSSAWKWKVNVKSLSRVQPSVTPWTAAFQAPPSMGFSRQEYWSGVPLPSPILTLRLHKWGWTIYTNLCQLSGGFLRNNSLWFLLRDSLRPRN